MLFHTARTTTMTQRSACKLGHTCHRWPWTDQVLNCAFSSPMLDAAYSWAFFDRGLIKSFNKLKFCQRRCLSSSNSALGCFLSFTSLFEEWAPMRGGQMIGTLDATTGHVCFSPHTSCATCTHFGSAQLLWYNNVLQRHSTVKGRPILHVNSYIWALPK